jgi:iron(III) transport system substrate-binding protein
MSHFHTRALALAALLAALVAPGAWAAEEVNVYSYRQPFLVEPLFAEFTADTGITVNTIFANKGLIERMAQEGRNSPADVLLTVDIGRLTEAVERDVSQPLESDVLSANIPEIYRDPTGHWFGLTRRARVVYASVDRVSEDSITYEELADPKWRGRICIRSGQHEYNLALFASMIAHHGDDAAREWLKGLRANLAHQPTGNDRQQVRSVYAGECDIAIANTYYMGHMQTNESEPEQQEWAKSVRILFPNSQDRGTHINISGMVLARHAPNKENAVKLMEFLSGFEAQRIYAEVNFEYPVHEDVSWSERVRSWGEFSADTIPLTSIAELRSRASEMVDEVGFND